jgi:hypothetical protein
MYKGRRPDDEGAASHRVKRYRQHGVHTHVATSIGQLKQHIHHQRGLRGMVKVSLQQTRPGEGHALAQHR